MARKAQEVTTELQDWVTGPVTPYRLARALNAAFAAAGIEKETPPQAVYGAVRAGNLEVSQFESGHMRVSPETANAFIAARIEKALAPDEAEDAESEASEG